MKVMGLDLFELQQGSGSDFSDCSSTNTFCKERSSHFSCCLLPRLFSWKVFFFSELC